MRIIWRWFSCRRAAAMLNGVCYLRAHGMRHSRRRPVPLWECAR